MVTLLFGFDLMFWAAVALTIVFFLDLATCWWATSLKICPLRRYRDKLCRYHKYTRITLIALVIIHIILHILFQVYGIAI